MRNVYPPAIAPVEMVLKPTKPAAASSSFADDPNSSPCKTSTPPVWSPTSRTFENHPSRGRQKTYWDFYDYGFWSKTPYGGHENLPPGFWVYIAQNWHIFDKSGPLNSANKTSSSSR